MNSYKDPFTPLITNPVNIDRPIQELQQAFAALGWLEKSFGRAYESRVIDPVSKKVKTYPQVWQGVNLDLLNVLPNDNLNSQSFFKVEEPIECVTFQKDQRSQMRARISAIFWFNLQRIDPAIDYSFAELLKGSVQRAITTIMFSSNSEIKILRVWETAKKVFEGYTLDEARDQELIYPFGGFRFECELTYIEDCPDSVYTL
jgi:hypothetical protein